MLFIYTTVPTKEAADTLGDNAIDKGLAACVDSWPIRSKYIWKGEKENVEQFMLMFTTHSEVAGELENYINQNHPNDIPLVARTAIDVINIAYQEWVNSVLKL